MTSIGVVGAVAPPPPPADDPASGRAAQAEARQQHPRDMRGAGPEPHRNSQPVGGSDSAPPPGGGGSNGVEGAAGGGCDPGAAGSGGQAGRTKQWQGRHARYGKADGFRPSAATLAKFPKLQFGDLQRFDESEHHALFMAAFWTAFPVEALNLIVQHVRYLLRVRSYLRTCHHCG